MLIYVSELCSCALENSLEEHPVQLDTLAKHQPTVCTAWETK